MIKRKIRRSCYDPKTPMQICKRVKGLLTTRFLKWMCVIIWMFLRLFRLGLPVSKRAHAVLALDVVIKHEKVSTSADAASRWETLSREYKNLNSRLTDSDFLIFTFLTACIFFFFFFSYYDYDLFIVFKYIDYIYQVIDRVKRVYNIARETILFFFFIKTYVLNLYGTDFEHFFFSTFFFLTYVIYNINVFRFLSTFFFFNYCG